MKRVTKFFIVILIVFFEIVNINAQQASIELNLFSDLSTIDLAAFAVEENLKNQPRIMQVMINPPGIEVIVEGKIDWQKDQSSGFREIGRFKTKPFLSRTFYNDEVGSIDIEIESSSYNSDLTKENLDKGKPSGIYRITLILYDKDGRFLDDTYKELTFLNPTPPTILTPTQGSIQDIGSILVQWTQSLGATSYRILANYLKPNENYEQALNAGNPLVNNRDVGNNTSINLRDILDRELLPDTTVVLVVKAIVSRPGGNDELISPIITFRTTSGTREESEEGYKQVNISPELLHLIDFLKMSGQVELTFIDKLMKGEISPNQIQITDENGNAISITDLNNILNYLEQNKESIISINFKSK